MTSNERLDDIIIGGMKLYQRSDQFCFSIDSIMLVHFCRFKHKHAYVELGSGTGILPLVGTALGAGHITGIEINPITADLSRRSVAYNHKEDVVTIVEGDYRTMRWQEVRTGSTPFDGVIINPPYFGENTGTVSASEDVATALHEGTTVLDEIIATARQFVRFGGLLWMVYTAPRVAYALDILAKYNFACKRLRFVHSFVDGPARLVLIEAMHGGKAGTIVEAPLIIYESPNVYTKEVAHWYERTE